MRLRIEQELDLLRQQYGEVEHAHVAGEDWFKLPRYGLPPGWRIGDQPAEEIPIAFLVKAAYPGTVPYGFLAPAGLTLNGKAPNNTGNPPEAPPFEGSWMHFSWSVENWAATADVGKGSNLLAWCRSFRKRFEEGV